PDFDHLRMQITPRTRVALVNTPLSPCGAVLRKGEAEALVEMLDAHDITLISDEAYETFVFGDHVHLSPARIQPTAVTVHSFSKTFALPGRRLAYIPAPPPIVEAVRISSLYSFLVTSSVAQSVGLGILADDHEAYTAAARRTCAARLEFLRSQLEATD